MTVSTQSRYIASVDDKEWRTYKQFLQALKQLGGKPDVSYFHSDGNTPEIEEVHSGFLSCSLDTWVRYFGEPENITEHHEFAVRRPFQHWEQRCVDGPVECDGRLFERWPDGPWVIVMRVSIPVSVGIGRTARLSR